LLAERRPPLIPRDQIVEIRERITADGTVHRPLDAADIDAALAACRAGGVESLAIALLHAYANTAHEDAVARRAAQQLPGIPVTRSPAISPQYRENERTNTGV